MTISQETIQFLNNINSATQRIGLEDLLAEIEANASGGISEESLNVLKEEILVAVGEEIKEKLDGITELINGLENKIVALEKEDKYSNLISTIEKSIEMNIKSIEENAKSIDTNAKSINDVSSKLDKYIASQKKESKPRSRIVPQTPPAE